jgi:hypothetical protein
MISLVSGETTSVYSNLYDKKLNFLQEWSSLAGWTPASPGNYYYSTGNPSVQGIAGYVNESQFAADMKNGGAQILKNKGITWASYDPEPSWAQSGTPANEQANPVYYSKLFYQIAKQNGLSVMQQPHSSYVSKYGASSWANISDIFLFQSEYYENYQLQNFSSATCNVASYFPSTVPFYFEESITSVAKAAFDSLMETCSNSVSGFYLAGGSSSDQLTFLESVNMAS